MGKVKKLEEILIDYIAPSALLIGAAAADVYCTIQGINASAKLTSLEVHPVARYCIEYFGLYGGTIGLKAITTTLFLAGAIALRRKSLLYVGTLANMIAAFSWNL